MTNADAEENGIVYETKDSIPDVIDDNALYSVTIKTAIPDFFGSPLRPGQAVEMVGSLVQKHREFIRVAKPARPTIPVR